jgi:hypothetical protein
MSFKAYHVLVPKAAVADPEPLRAEAALLATCPFSKLCLSARS